MTFNEIIVLLREKSTFLMHNATQIHTHQIRNKTMSSNVVNKNGKWNEEWKTKRVALLL